MNHVTVTRCVAILAALFLLAGCTSVAPEVVASTTVATVGGLAAIAEAWARAGIIPPEKAAEFINGLGRVEGIVHAGMQSAQLFAEALAAQKAAIADVAAKAAEAKAAAESSGGVSGEVVATGVAGTGLVTAALVNHMRDKARMVRGEPVGKQHVAPAS